MATISSHITRLHAHGCALPSSPTLLSIKPDLHSSQPTSLRYIWHSSRRLGPQLSNHITAWLSMPADSYTTNLPGTHRDVLQLGAIATASRCLLGALSLDLSTDLGLKGLECGQLLLLTVQVVMLAGGGRRHGGGVHARGGLLAAPDLDLLAAHQLEGEGALADTRAQVTVVEDGLCVVLVEALPHTQGHGVGAMRLALGGSVKEAGLVVPAAATVGEAPARQRQEHVVGPKVKVLARHPVALNLGLLLLEVLQA
mmetsp:Transcript_7609/g.18891  ORF Transcript_7609/g.18891 Transcript_7609/m.18891 type:complete len:255 (+) Transcript_7609:27-791(+)